VDYRIDAVQEIRQARPVPEVMDVKGNGQDFRRKPIHGHDVVTLLQEVPRDHSSQSSGGAGDEYAHPSSQPQGDGSETVPSRMMGPWGFPNKVRLDA
jgi:hypothetical protein